MQIPPKCQLLYTQLRKRALRNINNTATQRFLIPVELSCQREFSTECTPTSLLTQVNINKLIS